MAEEKPVSALPIRAASAARVGLTSQKPAAAIPILVASAARAKSAPGAESTVNTPHRKQIPSAAFPLFAALMLLSLASLSHSASCTLSLGSACTSTGAAPSCCATGLSCSIVSGTSGTCCAPPGSATACGSDSDCCFGKCIGSRCTASYACNSECSISAECGASCPICAESSGTYSCKGCISSDSATACGASSDCCSGSYCSPTDSKCTACFTAGTGCSSDSDCCTGRCEFDSNGAKRCAASIPSCSMEGAGCNSDSGCCGAGPSTYLLKCDLSNPGPGLPAYAGACRNCVPLGAACNATGSNATCCFGTCSATGDGNRCVLSGYTFRLPVGWLASGNATFDVNSNNPHSGSYSLQMNSTGYPASYIFDNSLVLKNYTRYYLEFWEYATAGPVRYAIYDSNNDAYLTASGEWAYSPLTPGGNESPVILSASVGNGSYAKFGLAFSTLSRNVSAVQLRLYPPLDGTNAYVDDAAVAEIYDFTIIGWVRPGTMAANGTLFSQMGTENGSQQGMNWTMDSGNILSMQFHSASGGSVSPTLNLSDRGLHMVAISVSRAGNYTTYLDGARVSSSAFLPGRLNATGAFFIGSANAAGVAPFNGTLDEVRFYRRALSRQEILLLFSGHYQDSMRADINISYSSIAGFSSKNLDTTFNAYLRVRNLAPDTILSMPFDANITSDSPGAIPDFSRSLSFGTKTGAAWTANGEVGGAYNFSGTTDKIQLAGPLITGTGDFTLAAWVLPTTNTYDHVMGNWGAYNPNGIRLTVSTGTYSAQVGGGSATASLSVPVGSWTHIAFTRKSGNATFYVNGVYAGAYSLPSSITGSTPFSIGNAPDGTGEHFTGAIDEVNVLSRALSQAEVLQLYNDASLSYAGAPFASSSRACPAGSLSSCGLTMQSFLPSRCGYLLQGCCFGYGSGYCLGANTFCNSSSICQPCGGTGQICCPGNSCSTSHLACSGGTCQCGAASQPCCLNNSAYNCSLSTLGCNYTASPAPLCQTCGGNSQVCCANGNCSTGYTCSAGVCGCGGPLQACCASGPNCTSGLSCTGGFCIYPCGVQSGACCMPGNTCNSTNLSCYNGLCNCGGNGQYCCNNNNCSATFACNTTVSPHPLCQSCGGNNSLCCTGNNCSTGFACNTSYSPQPVCQTCGLAAGQLCCLNATTGNHTDCGGVNLSCNTSASPQPVCYNSSSGGSALSACANLSTPNTVYTLAQSVSINGSTCFNVTAQNVTLNCAGYSATGNNSAGTYGVYSNQFNTTVQNCIISNFSTGIYFTGATNGAISGTAASTTYSGGSGITLVSSSSSNRISASSGTSNSGPGIFLSGSSSINLTDSNGTSGTNSALTLQGGSNNRVSNFAGTSTSGAGISFSGSSNNTISGSILASGSSRGIDMQSSSNNNTISGSQISGLDNTYGALLVFSSKNNTISNNTINGGAGTYAATLKSAATGNFIINNTLANAANLLYLDSGSGANTIYWNNFTTASGYYAQDLNGSNYYNATISGHGEGNVWFNVMNGSVAVTGSSLSTGYPSLYYGAAGSGYPYNSTNAGGKLSGTVVDYAPLTPNLTVVCSIPTLSGVVLASSGGTDTTSENLTVSFTAATTCTGRSVSNVTDWRLNSTSIMVLDMPFNTNVSSVSAGAVLDYSTNANNGQLGAGTLAYAPVWNSSGKVGGAYGLNGSQYISVPDSASLNGMPQLTIEVWAYKGVKNLQLVGYWAASGAKHYILRENAGVMQFYTFTSAQVGGGMGVGGTTGWHHYVATYNGSIMKLYKDGVVSGTTYSQSGSIATGTGSNLIIGAEYDMSSPQDGALDEVRIYRRSLTQEQITANYQAGLAGRSLNTLVSNELAAGNNWTASVTASDAYNDSSSVLSNQITVVP